MCHKGGAPPCFIWTLLLTNFVQHTHLDYLPKSVEVEFCELRVDGVLGSLRSAALEGTLLGSSLRSAAKEIDEEIRLRAKEMGCLDALSGDPKLSHALSGFSPGRRRHP